MIVFLLDFDVCSMMPPVCSQLCLSLSSRPGDYRCSCVDGYQLASDGRHCVVASARWKTWKSSTALLFYTQYGRVISRSAASGGVGKLVYRATGLVSALGLPHFDQSFSDYRSQFVYIVQ